MLRSLTGVRVAVARGLANDSQPVLRVHDAVRKSIEDVLGEKKEKLPVEVSADLAHEVIDLSGVPVEHQTERVARIYRPAREATQSGWNNTKVWKIDFDNRQRWENPLMGWASTGDPLSNVSMQLKFASKEEAIAFARKNNWTIEVDEPNNRQIKAKSYGANFSWNKRTRTGCK